MRKQSLMVLEVSLALAAGSAGTAEEHHLGQKGATAGPAAKPAVSSGVDGKQIPMMQDHMLKMHEQMHKIMQAKDDGERAPETGTHEDDAQFGRHDGRQHATGLAGRPAVGST